MIRPLAATALIAAATVVAVPAPAHAYSKCPSGTACGWTFYSDPQHTHVVGVHSTNCQGVVLDWGIKQGYSVYHQFTC